MKQFFLHIIFSPALNMVPFVVFVVLTIAAALIYRSSAMVADRQRAFFIHSIFVVIGFRIAFAALKTGLQWYAWAHDPMGKLFLPPAQGISVLLRYAWTHFWINVFLSLGVGLLMFLVLRALQRNNGRFFEAGEIELGTLLALVVGWPHFVVFFPLVFVFVILLSIVRIVFFREPFTTMGLPFIGATLIALLFAIPLLSFLHLAALVI